MLRPRKATRTRQRHPPRNRAGDPRNNVCVEPMMGAASRGGQQPNRVCLMFGSTRLNPLAIAGIGFFVNKVEVLYVTYGILTGAFVAAETVLLYLPAKAVNVGLSIEQGALIMSIYGAMFAFSQFIVGILADFIHIPTSYILMFSMLVMSATTVAFTFVHSFAFFVLFISLFAMCKGFASALRVVLVASILGVKKLEKGFSPLSLLIGVALQNLSECRKT
ncbi:SLC16A9 [Acanthosepion pharaonis]|uniref:SLC16A9 n=1 Tax=Acanthosepion pharaonis TaxID=158019 RepID=A0A812CVD3_ACAPH|nr:SLC16A9 [Sepia pharaonis]